MFYLYFYVQAALVIRGLFICEFAYSHWIRWSKMTIFQSKMDFLSANSRFAVQNDGTYLPRITRETCTLIFSWTAEVMKLYVNLSFVLIRPHFPFELKCFPNLLFNQKRRKVKCILWNRKKLHTTGQSYKKLKSYKRFFRENCIPWANPIKQEYLCTNDNSVVNLIGLKCIMIVTYTHYYFLPIYE